MLLCSVYYFVWIRSYVYYLCISMAWRSICSWRRFWHDFDTMTKSIEVQILVRSFWTSISYLVRTWTTYSSSIVLKSEKKVQFKEAAHRCLHYFFPILISLREGGGIGWGLQRHRGVITPCPPPLWTRMYLPKRLCNLRKTIEVSQLLAIYCVIFHYFKSPVSVL